MQEVQEQRLHRHEPSHLLDNQQQHQNLTPWSFQLIKQIRTTEQRQNQSSGSEIH